MRIRQKLIINTVIIAVLSVVTSSLIIGLMSYSKAKKALQHEVQNQLIAIRDAKKSQVEDYIELIKKQAVTFANNYMIIQAMQDFKSGFNNYEHDMQQSYSVEHTFRAKVIRYYLDAFGQTYYELNGGKRVDATPLLNLLDEAAFALQYQYIIKNPHPLYDKEKLMTANDGSRYSEFHTKYHKKILDYKEKFRFHDVFLIDADTGDVVYTVEKELDFATSLLDGPFANSSLGDVFRKAQELDKPGLVVLSDYRPHLASYDSQAAFIAAPIFSGRTKLGILIFQLPTEKINNIMISHGQWKQSGFGETGEAYIIGSDQRMRSVSRFFVEDEKKYLKLMHKLKLPNSLLLQMQAKNDTIGLQPVKTLATSRALAGKSGVDIIKDYRKIKVLSAYSPLNIPGLKWGIISEVDVGEAFAPIRALAWWITFLTIIIIGLVLGCAIYVGLKLSKRISEPLESFSEIILNLARSQDLTQRIEVSSNDELQDVAEALNKLLDSFQETLQETLESSNDMRETAERLMSMAENDEHDIEEIKESGDLMHKLSDRLDSVSGKFKLFEDEQERVEDW